MCWWNMLIIYNKIHLQIRITDQICIRIEWAAVHLRDPAGLPQGGAELCVHQRDRQHGADHAERGQALGGGGVGEWGRWRPPAAEEDHQAAGPPHHQPQRRLPQEAAAHRTEHVWGTGAGAGAAGKAAPHRGQPVTSQLTLSLGVLHWVSSSTRSASSLTVHPHCSPTLGLIEVSQSTHSSQLTLSL